MNVSLTPELERMVEQKVKTGRYQNNSEVVRAALRALFDAEAEHERKLEWLRIELDKGLESIKRGDVVSAKEVRERFLGENRK